MDNIVFARLPDAGKMLAAKIKGIEKKGSFTKISIGIHPNDNTATVWLKGPDLVKVIEDHGNTVNLVEID